MRDVMTWTSTALLVLGLGLSPTYAQEATTTEDTPVEEATPATEAPSEEAAPVEEATPAEEAAPAEAPAPVQPAEPAFTTTTFNDWEMRCTPDGLNCFLYQLVRNEAGDPVIEYSMVLLPEGDEATAGATAVTPLGTLLTEGLKVQIDNGNTLQYPFNWCTRSGCFARFGLSDGSLASMRAGSKAKMTLTSVAAPDRPLTVELSLRGFTAAYNALPKN